MVRLINKEVCEVVIWYVEKQHEGCGKALNFVDAEELGVPNGNGERFC
jgi:hypothetical protein